MKKVVFIACIAMAAMVMNAQPAAKQIIVGADLTLGGSVEKSKYDGTSTTDTKSFAIGIRPMAAYFLSDKLAVGAAIGISSATEKNPGAGYDEKYSSFMFEFQPFARYYLISGQGGVFAEAAIGLGVGINKHDYGEGTDEQNVTQLSAGVMPGVYYYITPKIALEGKFGFLGLRSHVAKEGDYKEITNEFGLDLSSSYLSFGFTYTL